LRSVESESRRADKSADECKRMNSRPNLKLVLAFSSQSNASESDIVVEEAGIKPEPSAKGSGYIHFQRAGGYHICGICDSELLD